MSAKNSRRVVANPDRAERRLVYLSSKQLAGLRRVAKRAGTSQQALVRAGIDLVLAAQGGK